MDDIHALDSQGDYCCRLTLPNCFAAIPVTMTARAGEPLVGMKNAAVAVALDSFTLPWLGSLPVHY